MDLKCIFINVETSEMQKLNEIEKFLLMLVRLSWIYVNLSLKLIEVNLVIFRESHSCFENTCSRMFCSSFFFLEKWESNKNRNTVGVFLNHLRFFQDFFLIGDVIQNYWYYCTTSRARLYAEKFLVSSMKIGIRKWPFSLTENILFFDASISIWENKIFVIGKKLYWF